MSEALHIVTGATAEAAAATTPLAPFDERTLAFLSALSEALLGRPEYRAHPGLVALGFWLRPSAVAQFADGAGAPPAGYLRRPAGVALHLTPANVDNLFVYSWVISLLCGNANIIRLSSKDSTERDLLLSQIDRLLDQDAHAAIRERTAIVRYGHDDAVTTALSGLAERRVIWGSDDTVAHLRGLPAPPLCQDIVFPDRDACALLSARAVLDTDDLAGLVESFYRDSYGFNQMACSSPRLLLWLADGELDTARDRFWSALAGHVAAQHPPLSPAELMDKQVAMQSMALQANIRVRPMPDRLLQVVELDGPAPQLEAEHCGGGLFLEGRLSRLDDIAGWLTRKHQTLTHWGIAETQLAALLELPRLPDRIVPVGQALNFDPVWDGMNLFDRLSRVIQLR